MRTRIADELPYGGTWTFSLEPGDSACVLTLTEDGEVYNVIFRFVSRFIMGYNGSLETYLRDLGKKFGESVTPLP